MPSKRRSTDYRCRSESRFRDFGQKDRNFGTIATTSFFPAKPLGCYGDGGAVFTNDDELAVLLKSLRTHGTGSHKYEHVHIGLNSRLDTVQAMFCARN